MWTEATSPSVMFSFISQRNIESMLRGNAIAIVLIALIMVISLRSWSIGLLSIIPNVMPIMISFGIWAILVKQIGMAAATVTATSLGIVVDDTVHFLSKYLRARREGKMSKRKAVKYAFENSWNGDDDYNDYSCDWVWRFVWFGVFDQFAHGAFNRACNFGSTGC